MEVGKEHSDVRAQFVRAQVELSRILGDSHKVEDLPVSVREEAERLKRLQDELLAEYGSHWVPKIKGVVAYDFRRGFLEGAVIDKEKLGGGQEEFVKLLKELKEHGVRRIELQGFSASEIIERLNTEEMEHFTEVVAQKAGLTAEHVASLSDTPHLTHLRRLGLDGNQIEESGIRTLYRSFKNLRSVGRLSRYIPEAQFQAIAEEWIRNLNLPMEMRRDAFLELVDNYGVTLNYENIQKRFPAPKQIEEQRAVIKFLLEDARFKKRLLASYDYKSASKYFSILEKDPASQERLLKAILDYESDPVRLTRVLEGHLSNIRRDISDEGVLAQALVKHKESLDKEGIRIVAEIYPRLKANDGDWGKARSEYLSDEKVSVEKKAEYLKLHTLTKEFESLIAKVPEKERSKVKLAMHKGSDALFFRRLAEKNKIPQSIIEKMSPESMTYQDFSLKKPFKMKTTQVTQFEYALVMKKNPSRFQDGPNSFEIMIDGKPIRVSNRPVEQLTWHEANEYATKLSDMTGKNYLLPTEAQWNLAARGKVSAPGLNGNNVAELNDQAWTFENSENTTHPVAEKRPDRRGLYDMRGNVLEWIAGVFQVYDPVKESTSQAKGGSWRREARGALSDRSYGLNPSVPEDDRGLRLVEEER